MPSQFRSGHLVLHVTLAAMLSACAATTHLEGAQPGTTLVLREIEPMQLPQDRDLKSKATGQHEFAATSPSGKTMYGILPLHVSGAKMATSIALFAPALFIGGFRDVLPYYQFDPDANELRYRSSPTDEWRVVKPLMVESERARKYFAANGICGGAKLGQTFSSEQPCAPETAALAAPPASPAATGPAEGNAGH